MSRMTDILRQRSAWIVFAVSAALLFAVHLAYLHRGFYTDDYQFMLFVPKLNLATLPHFFSPHLKWFYRPIFLLYFAAICSIVGHDSEVFHAISLVLHAANIALLYCLVGRLTGKVWPAVAASALFFGTTMSSEAVWWISSTTTLLAGMFTLGSLLLWLKYRETGQAVWYGLCVAAMTAALLSKEDACFLPVALFTLDRVYVRNALPWSRIVGEFGLIAIITLTYLHFDLIAAQTAVWPGAHSPVSKKIPGRLLTASTFMTNVTTKVFPAVSMAASYQWPVWLLALAAAVASRKRPEVLFLVLVYCMSVLPIPIASGDHVFADRFYYLPLELLCALSLTGVAALAVSDSAEAKAAVYLLSVGFTAPVIEPYVPMPTDLVMQWTATLIVVALFWAGVRAKRVHPSVAVGLTAAGVIRIALFGSLEFAPLYAGPLLALGMSAMGAIQWNGRLCVLATLCFYTEPLFFALVYLAVSLSWPYAADMIKKRAILAEEGTRSLAPVVD